MIVYIFQEWLVKSFAFQVQSLFELDIELDGSANQTATDSVLVDYKVKRSAAKQPTVATSTSEDTKVEQD